MNDMLALLTRLIYFPSISEYHPKQHDKILKSYGHFNDLILILNN